MSKVHRPPPNKAPFVAIFLCGALALLTSWHAMANELPLRAAFCAVGALSAGILLAVVANNFKIEVALRMHVVTGSVAMRNSKRLAYELKQVAAGGDMVFDELSEFGSVEAITEGAFDELQPDLERIERLYLQIEKTAWTLIVVAIITTAVAIARL